MKPQDIDVSKLKTGDVFLQRTGFIRYRPITWFAWLIRVFTKSYYNHTSECIMIDRKPYMVESLWKWVTLRSWDMWLKVDMPRDMARLRMDWFELVTDSDEEYKYIDKALAEVTKGYDFKGIVKMFLYIITGKRNQDWLTSETEWWCSEFTAYMKDLDWRQRYMPKDFLNDRFTILAK